LAALNLATIHPIPAAWILPHLGQISPPFFLSFNVEPPQSLESLVPFFPSSIS